MLVSSRGWLLLHREKRKGKTFYLPNPKYIGEVLMIRAELCPFRSANETIQDLNTSSSVIGPYASKSTAIIGVPEVVSDLFNELEQRIQTYDPIIPNSLPSRRVVYQSKFFQHLCSPSEEIRLSRQRLS